MNNTKATERGYKVTIVLLLGLAAFSSAMKDLNRLQELVSNVQEFSSQWRGNGFVASNQKSVSAEQGSCPNDAALLSNTLASASNDRVDPEVGGKVEVVASKKANRSLPRLEGFTPGPARVLKSETLARSGKGNWPDHVQIKAFDREVALNLVRTVVTDIKGEGFNGDAISHFPAGLFDKVSRKQPHVRTGNIKRGLILKRLDGNINLRRSS